MRSKQLIILLGTAVSISFMSLTNLQAQNSEQYLQQIAANTKGILTNVNQLPNLITNLLTLCTAFLDPIPKDDNQLKTLSTASTQLGDYIIQGQALQQNNIQSLNNDLLNNDGTNVFKSNIPPNSQLTGLYYANDLTFSTLLGNPPNSPDPRTKAGFKVNSPYNYIKNAAGLNIWHVVPSSSWKDGGAKTRYQNYFNTVMAVESFDSYILSSQLANANPQQNMNAIQQQMVTQASDPSWAMQIASEKIGYVIRQLLLYQSQLFILMTQLVQSQQQMVTAQAMTNSLLIAINQTNENVMVANAKHIQPSTD